MATAYLARWSGPVTTTSDPWSLSCTDTSSGSVQQHVRTCSFCHTELVRPITAT
jgi:C1A family cysteine protease